MKVIESPEALQQYVAQERDAGAKVGFVPTMGALHPGHISLVERAVLENDVTIVSIFVNPTQFNDPRDLLTYPRTLEEDCFLLEPTGCQALFVPSVEAIYPQEDTRQFDFGSVGNVMEGAFRPGHFNGVAQVVSRLFDIVKPDRAYFGEKDFQQIAIIRCMATQLNLDITIVSCPIVREKDGLAMSSRNTRLSYQQRESAPLIAATLEKSLTFAVENSVADTVREVIASIEVSPYLRVEYYQIVDGYTLQPISTWDEASYIVGCIAVFCGEVRLIDNITYRACDKKA